jgi:hypothetical protein
MEKAAKKDEGTEKTMKLFPKNMKVFFYHTLLHLLHLLYI